MTVPATIAMMTRRSRCRIECADDRMAHIADGAERSRSAEGCADLAGSFQAVTRHRHRRRNPD